MCEVVSLSIEVYYIRIDIWYVIARELVGILATSSLVDTIIREARPLNY